MDRALAGRPAPPASHPVPGSVWDPAWGEEGKSQLSSGGTHLVCWTPGHSHPNMTILAHTKAFTQLDILGHTSHTH